jgi:hypothetical protein
MLTDADTRFLESRGWRFETQAEGELVNLVIFGYELPSGYTVTHADLLIRLPGGFPDAAPNMFWLCPPATHANNAEPAGAEQREQYLGRTWQRWSRHLSENEWRAGIDNLQTFMRFIRTNLEAAVLVVA